MRDDGGWRFETIERAQQVQQEQANNTPSLLGAGGGGLAGLLLGAGIGSFGGPAGSILLGLVLAIAGGALGWFVGPNVQKEFDNARTPGGAPATVAAGNNLGQQQGRAPSNTQRPGTQTTTSNAAPSTDSTSTWVETARQTVGNLTHVTVRDDSNPRSINTIVFSPHPRGAGYHIIQVYSGAYRTDVEESRSVVLERPVPALSTTLSPSAIRDTINDARRQKPESFITSSLGLSADVMQAAVAVATPMAGRASDAIATTLPQLPFEQENSHGIGNT